MKAILKVSGRRTCIGVIMDKEFEMNMSRDGNKLVLEFNSLKGIWELLNKGEFTVTLHPAQEEIGCSTHCRTCLTPIC